MPEKKLAKQLAHDVLNALTVLQAKQEAILKKEDLSAIYEIALSSIVKIKNLIAYCKSQLDGPNKSSFNIGDLLQKTLKDIQSEYSDFNIKIQNHYDLILEIDYSEFLNAVENIIKNAYESSANEITISVEKNGIFFTDNGTGMTKENLQHIKNFQSTKREGHGIGLLS
ncbi:MAG: hypothetical protein COV37_12040, partial [Bdellovibrio sp. CG11_big_fil_rev_8_21_14_0_20_39_38]